MAYHGHPSTPTEASLEETRAREIARTGGAAGDFDQLRGLPASTRHSSRLLVLLGILGVAGLLILLFLLARIL